MESQPLEPTGRHDLCVPAHVDVVIAPSAYLVPNNSRLLTTPANLEQAVSSHEKTPAATGKHLLKVLTFDELHAVRS